jgi:hypothetical protein
MDNGWKLWGKKEKKVILDEKMGKVAEGKIKERKKRKEKGSIVFLKFYWCLKMEILCVLMGYLILKIIFF